MATSKAQQAAEAQDQQKAQFGSHDVTMAKLFRFMSGSKYLVELCVPMFHVSTEGLRSRESKNATEDECPHELAKL
ncbi:hypothetical protein RRG08_063769 [Elysia crispata]|uniref:Uncharacterized protein n=1 Tax=Elysia crispata TaxID=231223 RepID=A0AAE1AJZ0_9GAST|nr:hypothetical protein RRG08_063769 [Elysia crispata]